MQASQRHAQGAPELTYNIASRQLTGCIDGRYVSSYAVSGGRAGSSVAGAVDWRLVNNPLATRIKLPDDKSHPGGPLPMGLYRVAPHERHRDRLRLIPVDPRFMQGRHSMLIHGTGKRGSDGCIVPTDFADVLRLCELVSHRQASGGPAVRLQVVAIGQDLDRTARQA